MRFIFLPGKPRQNVSTFLQTRILMYNLLRHNVLKFKENRFVGTLSYRASKSEKQQKNWFIEKIFPPRRKTLFKL